MNILLVDDWEDFEVLFRRSIRKHSNRVQVKQVFDITKAIEAIESLLPQIVILDVRMPGGNGIELIPHVKRILPESTIIMFTGHADPETELTAKDRGASHFFSKGDGYDQLIETVNTLIAAPAGAIGK